MLARWDMIARFAISSIIGAWHEGSGGAAADEKHEMWFDYGSQ